MSRLHSRPVVRVPVRYRLSQQGHLVVEWIDVGWPSKVTDAIAPAKAAYLDLAYPGAVWATCTGAAFRIVAVEGEDSAVRAAAKRFGIDATVSMTTGTYTSLLLWCARGAVPSVDLDEGVSFRAAGGVTLDAGQATPFGITRLVGVGLGFADLPDQLRRAVVSRRRPAAALDVPPRLTAGREDAEDTQKWTTPREDLPFSELDAVLALRGTAWQQAVRIDDHEHEDLMQVALEAVVRAHRACPHRSWPQFAGYAREAIHNALVSYARRHNRHRSVQIRGGDDGSWEWPDLDVRVTLHEALLGVPHAGLVVLHAAGFSDEELAHCLGVSRAAATKRRQRAGGQLAAALERSEVD